MLRLFLICCIALTGCLGQSIKTGSPRNGAFSDAMDCYHYSELNQKVNIPIAAGNTIVSTTIVEVPLSVDAGAFRLCMEHKGHPATVANIKSDDYLNQSRYCYQQARGSSNPNQAYSDCVQRGKITVETLPPDK